MKIAVKPTLPGNRLSTTTIKHAMDTNRATNNGNTIELSISVIPLYFPTHCNYLDWSLFSTTAIAPPLPLIGSTAALTAAPSTGTTTPASAYTFDPRALPTDVREAYHRSRSRSVVTKTMVHGNFVGGNRYHLDGQRLILRDGTLFLMDQPLDEKGLLRDPVLCFSDTQAGIRLWYTALQQHTMDHGYFVQPLWLFRKDIGGSSGFSAGDDVNDDLPLRLCIPLEHMKQPLFRLLSKKGMFPPDSSAHVVLRSQW